MNGRNLMGRIVYLLPFVVLAIGFVAYFLIIPHTYGRAISFFDWLFGDPETIIRSLRNPNVVLPQIHRVIVMKLLWWIWLAGFIGSLLLVGRRLQSQTEPINESCILKGNEPFQNMHDVGEILRQSLPKGDSGAIRELLSSVKTLEERLLSESDFGYGGHSIIECENDIARKMQNLSDLAEHIHDGDLDDNIRIVGKEITIINSLLRKRMEIKKRG